MTPLWTTATRPSAETCGWALASVAGPWVAHRVWLMPRHPGAGRSRRWATRLAIRPDRRRRCIRPGPVRVASPALSYPRYSSRRSPSTRIGSASRRPAYPTIPHMGPTSESVERMKGPRRVGPGGAARLNDVPPVAAAGQLFPGAVLPDEHDFLVPTPPGAAV